MVTTKSFNSITYGEGRTFTGQLVEFRCPAEDGQIDRIKAFLRDNVESIMIPTTSQIKQVQHGTYGAWTRYKITQHKYAGGRNNFVEVLEIQNAPENRCGVVLNEYTPQRQRSAFSEWETVEDAIAAYEKFLTDANAAKENLPKLKGFKRWIACGLLHPWFYAIGEEELVGDYTFPHGLQDDPIYRFGKQFVAYDEKGIPSVKTCMGTRFVKSREEHYPHKEHQYRLVYWSDGTAWDERDHEPWWRSNPDYTTKPRAIEDGELWAVEALECFKELLAGKTTNFTINFTDGNKFVGKVVKAAAGDAPTAEGDYLVIAHRKGMKPKEGWVNGFKPTPEVPNLVEFVKATFTERGQEVERIEVKESKLLKGGRKWAGVFFRRSL